MQFSWPTEQLRANQFGSKSGLRVVTGGNADLDSVVVGTGARLPSSLHDQPKRPLQEGIHCAQKEFFE